jgi:hypothetical protein
MGDRTSMGFRCEYGYGICGIDLGYGISIWLSTISIWHPGYRYGIWANDMGDDRIDMALSHTDMGYLITLDRYCSPRHRMASIERNEGSHALNDVASNIWQAIQ